MKATEILGKKQLSCDCKLSIFYGKQKSYCLRILTPINIASDDSCIHDLISLAKIPGSRTDSEKKSRECYAFIDRQGQKNDNKLTTTTTTVMWELYALQS